MLAERLAITLANATPNSALESGPVPWKVSYLVRQLLAESLSLAAAFGDVVRQPPANGPLLRPKPIGPLNRACPVGEMANIQGAIVHEPQDSRPVVRRVDHGLCAATVCVPHSPYDRRLVIGGGTRSQTWRSQGRQGRYHPSEVEDHWKRRAVRDRVLLGRKRSPGGWIQKVIRRLSLMPDYLFTSPGHVIPARVPRPGELLFEFIRKSEGARKHVWLLGGAARIGGCVTRVLKGLVWIGRRAALRDRRQ